MYKKPILDIIVPSYKTSKFIDMYPDLLYSEELEGKVRFLLIDDGSPDDTLSKIDSLSKRYPNYFVCYTKPNGGHGSVINFGINMAKSVYFKVMDGDDYLDKNELIKFVTFLESSDFDVVITKYSKDYISNGRNELCLSWINSNKEMENVNALPTFSIALASSTFKLSLFKANSIKVREGVFYEDLEYSFFPLPYIKKIYCFDSVLYHYIQYDQPSNGYTQSITLTSIIKHASDHNHVMNDILDFYSNIDDEKRSSIDKYALDFVSKQATQNYRYLLLNSSKEAKKSLILFDKKIKRNKGINAIVKKNKTIKALRFSKYLSFGLLSKLYKKRFNAGV